MQLQGMDNMPAWDCMQLLLQDSPDIQDNLVLHTSVQLLHFVHTSTNIQCKSISKLNRHLTVYSPVVTVCTTYFSNQQMHIKIFFGDQLLQSWVKN
jgi:hypothetical protein